MINECYICKSKSLSEILNLGDQPICNRFLSYPLAEEKKYLMIVAQCNTCGLIQLVNPVPAAELLPQYEWITYNEPEEHLDGLADLIIRLHGIDEGASVGGISFKDDTLLSCLRKRGIDRLWRIDPDADLGVKALSAGVETVQDRLTSEAAKKITDKYGLVDVIIARHILEHAYDIFSFIKVLKELIKPDGYIILEVPDCAKAIDEFDYTTLWEEHIVYFTPATFRQSFGFAGLSLVSFKSYPYPFENSLIGIAQIKNQKGENYSADGNIEEEKRRGVLFSRTFSERRAKVRDFLAEFRQGEGGIAMFGAGHLACTFINLFDLKEFIEFMVDDNPNKKGLFMPGSRLPIHASAELLKRRIKLCLLSLSPQAEQKVIANNQEFIRQGGRFSSIFPGSSLALKV